MELLACVHRVMYGARADQKNSTKTAGSLVDHQKQIRCPHISHVEAVSSAWPSCEGNGLAAKGSPPCVLFREARRSGGGAGSHSLPRWRAVVTRFPRAGPWRERPESGRCMEVRR